MSRLPILRLFLALGFAPVLLPAQDCPQETLRQRVEEQKKKEAEEAARREREKAQAEMEAKVRPEMPPSPEPAAEPVPPPSPPAQAEVPDPPRNSRSRQPVPDALSDTKADLHLPRTWKSKEGRQIVAKALSHDDGIVKLQKEDGQIVSIPLATLSEEDRTWLNYHPQLQEAKAPFVTLSASTATRAKKDWYGLFCKGTDRRCSIDITVRNVDKRPAEVEVMWITVGLSYPDKKRFALDRTSKIIRLTPTGGEFKVRTPEVTARAVDSYFYKYLGSRYDGGATLDGWIALVVWRDKIVASVTNDPQVSDFAKGLKLAEIGSALSDGHKLPGSDDRTR